VGLSASLFGKTSLQREGDIDSTEKKLFLLANTTLDGYHFQINQALCQRGNDILQECYWTVPRKSQYCKVSLSSSTLGYVFEGSDLLYLVRLAKRRSF
jgi:hypothetical protein